MFFRGSVVARVCGALSCTFAVSLVCLVIFSFWMFDGCGL